jgi:radical SAM superfamily enzyme YgiQ (UPF0313 family)
MKVVLINPAQKGLRDPTAYPPLGLCYLGSVLVAAGIEVEAVNLADSTANTIPDADFYGISCTSATYPEVVKLCKMLRTEHDGKIVVGGAHPSVMPIQTWIETSCDYLITGEAEYVLRDLVLGKTNRQIIHAGIIDKLDELPLPARHLFKKEEVVDYSGIHGQERGKGATSIISSRGCPRKCSFCCRGHEMYSKFRFRSQLDIKREIEEVMDNYNITHFRFIDDAFTANPWRVSNLCEVLRGLEITWMCITRSDWITRPLLEAMKEAGCIEVDYGMESGSQRILDAMNKGTTVDQNIKAVLLTRETGLRAKTYLMCDYPGETEADMAATKRFMCEAKPDKYTLASFTPLPGSRLYKTTGKDWFYPDDRGSDRYIMFKSWLEREEWR